MGGRAEEEPAPAASTRGEGLASGSRATIRMRGEARRREACYCLSFTAPRALVGSHHLSFLSGLLCNEESLESMDMLHQID